MPLTATGLGGEEAGFVRANLRWNFLALSLDYGLFGLGLTLASTSTVLVAFAERLGASNLVIGTLPALQTVGWALPSLFAANYVERQSRKLPLILAVTVGERVPYLAMGAVALFLAVEQPGLALLLTLLLVATMALSGGSIMPAWMELIAKVIPTTLRGRFFALGNVISGLTGVGGAALVAFFLSRYPYPLGYALCFFASFAALATSFVFLASTREYAAPPTKPRVDFGVYLRRLPSLLRGDRNFSRYLGARAFGVASSMGQAFFTVFALSRLGASEEQVGTFTFFILVAQTVSTVVWGWLADRRGHKAVLALGAVAAAVGNVAALLAADPVQLYLSFAMMGTYVGAVSVSNLTILLEFGKPEDRPTYVGLGSTLLAPVSFAAPLVGGLLADNVGYEIVFGISVGMALASVLLLTFTVRDPRGLAPADQGSPQLD